jgi:hypothetical protein
MPNFDGTGPRGQGPMTGRGLGPCGRGRRLGFWGGYGMGFGGGYGYGRRFISPKNELAALEDEKEALEEELEAINNEIAALKKQDK